MMRCVHAHVNFIEMFNFYSTQDVSMEVYNPRNTQAVELYFRGEKMAKVPIDLFKILLHFMSLLLR